jgi:hypothetical protein
MGKMLLVLKDRFAGDFIDAFRLVKIYAATIFSMLKK